MHFNYRSFNSSDYRQISDSLFSPNTFRIILNKYFDQQIPLLKKKELLNQK